MVKQMMNTIQKLKITYIAPFKDTYIKRTALHHFLTQLETSERKKLTTKSCQLVFLFPNKDSVIYYMAKGAIIFYKKMHLFAFGKAL